MLHHSYQQLIFLLKIYQAIRHGGMFRAELWVIRRLHCGLYVRKGVTDGCKHRLGYKCLLRLSATEGKENVTFH